MHYTSEHIRDVRQPAKYLPASTLSCNWQMLRNQLLKQWNHLTHSDLDRAGPNPQRIAILIEGKYGIPSELVENYLRNFERTMPLQ